MLGERGLPFCNHFAKVSPVTSAAPEFVDVLATLVERRQLRAEQIRWLMEGLIAGSLPEAEAAALLVALRMKGETATEIAAAAAVLRQHMIRLETGPLDVLDTCGTGGDGAGTFNISTATALVTAGAGVPVVKHGNRAVSSQSGSADVLAELGVPVEAGLDWARRCLRRRRPGVLLCAAVPSGAEGRGGAAATAAGADASSTAWDRWPTRRRTPLSAARRRPAGIARSAGRGAGPAGHAARLPGLEPGRAGRGQPVRHDAGPRSAKWRSDEPGMDGDRFRAGAVPRRRAAGQRAEGSAALVRQVLDGRPGPRCGWCWPTPPRPCWPPSE